MKKYLLSLLSFLTVISADCQEIKVKLMEYLPNDLAARTHPRPDANGVNCALIRVVVPAVKGMKFDGWVVGDYEYQPGEYQVYVPEGAKKIKFRHENYAPGEIVFNMPIESQCVYKVVLDIPDLGTIYVTQSSAMLAEGSRLYALRKYAEARQSYENAMMADDVVKDLIPTIQSDIAQCDTCMLYEKYTMGALAKIREMKNGSGTQQELVKYASAGIEYLQVLNRYNPHEFYASRIDMLEKLIQDLPLEIRFTLVKWLRNDSGFYEAGKLPNVEVWAYTGDVVPVQNTYKNDGRYKNLVGKSNNFSQLGITDNNGVVDLQFDRKALPTGLFFRPVGYDGKFAIYFMDSNEILQSRGEYNKRRIRIKMYETIK